MFFLVFGDEVGDLLICLLGREMVVFDVCVCVLVIGEKRLYNVWCLCGFCYFLMYYVLILGFGERL